MFHACPALAFRVTPTTTLQPALATRVFAMAPKKRKRTLQTTGAPPVNRICVKCPACEKEVPSFFVNSHLDLECRALTKDPALPGLPAPLPSVGEKLSCSVPKIDQLQGSSIRTDERILQSFLKNDSNQASSLLALSEPKSWEDERGEVGTGISAHKDCASYGGGSGVRDLGCAHEIQLEMFRNHSMSLKDDGLENIGREGNDSRKEHSQNVRISVASSSRQSVHPKADRPSTQLRKPEDLASIANCFPSLPPPKVMAPKGLQVVEDFITPEEEDHLLHCLDTDVSNPWKLSKINGIHQGKAYGIHIHGDYKRKVVSQANSPMPDFVLPYVKRMRDKVPALKEFFPNEMNSIDYRKEHGHYLKAHMDDRQLSGKILVNLSLAGGCFMTYTRELRLKETYRVKLAPRSLQILTGESRYSYTHGIQRDAILDPRRVSMTFRQSVETSQNIRSSRLHD